jgi:hypothetical protein
VSQDFPEIAQTDSLVVEIPVKKPNPTWWVRTHSDPAYQLITLVLEIKDAKDSGIYLIDAPLHEAVAEAEPKTVSPRLLIASVNRKRTPFIWPVRLSGDGSARGDGWNRTAREAINRAQTQWVRVEANMDLGGYDIKTAKALTADPVWPKLTFHQWLEIAFRDAMIDDWNHPVLKGLRGE